MLRKSISDVTDVSICRVLRANIMGRIFESCILDLYYLKIKIILKEFSNIFFILLQVLSFIILYYNRLRGLCSSGLLFLFWFLLAIAGLAQLRTEIVNTINMVIMCTNNIFCLY